MTMKKALNSIEFHKSEATKAILKTRFIIDEKEIVHPNLALNYISCESLCVSIIKLFISINKTGSFD
jgi:hypothetical protein